jgi:hypothetical protein
VPAACAVAWRAHVRRITDLPEEFVRTASMPERGLDTPIRNADPE